MPDLNQLLAPVLHCVRCSVWQSGQQAWLKMPACVPQQLPEVSFGALQATSEMMPYVSATMMVINIQAYKSPPSARCSFIDLMSIARPAYTLSSFALGDACCSPDSSQPGVSSSVGVIALDMPCIGFECSVISCADTTYCFGALHSMSSMHKPGFDQTDPPSPCRTRSFLAVLLALAHAVFRGSYAHTHY